MKVKKKLRIFISNTFYPARAEGGEGDDASVASWELRVEGRLLEDHKARPSQNDPSKLKRKFSSFFKSLVIELDKELYGPDNHLVEWHRTATTQETDGFQVKRPGDKNVRCTICCSWTTSPTSSSWTHAGTPPGNLWCPEDEVCRDPGPSEPAAVPADPIIINHTISVEGVDQKKTSCYDIDVEVDDNLKTQMNNFLLSTNSQQDIQTLDTKIHETVETINSLKTNREFYLSFAKDPQQFIQKWLISQNRDLKTMTDVVGNPEEERRAQYYFQPWMHEAVNRYFYSKIQQKRAELEQALGIRNN
ncbi:Brahma-associated protein [Chionoecetes opilio]|uniref:Brahma-associated protein n=1 Tax=Chionoecetes opilio TaxID=41210 RepID=A0A8J4Y9U1_CHIOP|nr:Brahma-associated protein [Chionoecetes opilio]